MLHAGAGSCTGLLEDQKLVDCVGRILVTSGHHRFTFRTRNFGSDMAVGLAESNDH